MLQEDIADLDARLDSAYETAVTASLEEYDTQARAYEDRINMTLDGFETDLDHAFETLATERLTSLENQLDNAREQFDERRKHRQETEQYRRQQRRLLIVFATLGALVVALLTYILPTSWPT
jgi:DNA repair exonuclease SbcCD ATPase subunit